MAVGFTVSLWLGKPFLLSCPLIFTSSFISLNFLLVPNTFSINHYSVVTIHSNDFIVEVLVSPVITQPISKWGRIIATANTDILASPLVMKSSLVKQEFIARTT